MSPPANPARPGPHAQRPGASFSCSLSILGGSAPQGSEYPIIGYLQYRFWGSI